MEADHKARYLASKTACAGKRVLDAACGSGYGTAILAQEARAVVGIDVDREAVEWASAHHAAGNSSFVVASVSELPFPAESFDVVVSFETLEHIDKATQELFADEIKRVLDTDGVLIMSTPEAELTSRRGGENKFHIHERSKASFESMLRSRFRNVSLYYQNLWIYAEICPIDSSVEVSVVPPTIGQNLIAVCSDGTVPTISFHERMRHDYVDVLHQAARDHSEILRRAAVDNSEALHRAAIDHSEALSRAAHDHAEDIASRAGAICEMYESSLSWKVTAPLRNAGVWAARMRGRDG